MEREIAQFILGMLARATVPATDADLQNALASRQWLRQIAEGKLIVTGMKATPVNDSLAAPIPGGTKRAPKDRAPASFE